MQEGSNPWLFCIILIFLVLPGCVARFSGILLALFHSVCNHTVQQSPFPSHCEQLFGKSAVKSLLENSYQEPQFCAKTYDFGMRLLGLKCIW